MSIGIEVLHLAVVRPLVGHVEGGTDGTTVGVNTPLLEQVAVELLVQVVDRVVEGEQHDLRHLFDWHVSGNVLSAAEAVGQKTHVLTALGGCLVRSGSWVDGLWPGWRVTVDVDELLRLGHDRI